MQESNLDKLYVLLETLQSDIERAKEIISKLQADARRDYLKDIVQHTHALGTIELVKIIGTDSETSIEAIAEDRSVIMQAKFKNPVPEFIGTFGMPNLNKLKILLNL